VTARTARERCQGEGALCSRSRVWTVVCGMALSAAGCGRIGYDPLDTSEEVVVSGRLAHRYSFAGTGTTAIDSVGGAHGTIVGGAAVDDSGQLVLDGVDDYVELPGGLATQYAAVTLVAWVMVTEHLGFQRIFDFGRLSTFRDASYLFLSPSTPSLSLRLTTNNHDDEDTVDAGNVFVVGVERQVASVVTDTGMTLLEQYVDGAFIASSASMHRWTLVSDTRCYLGRSNFDVDPYLHGVFEEFRIYDGALTAGDVAVLYEAGPAVAVGGR
jgi:hypothetical protein